MKFLTQLFSNKDTQVFNAALQLAETLHADLKWVPATTNGMDRIVHFFTITSVCQDKFKKLLSENPSLYFKDDKKRKFFGEFTRILKNIGRCEYGWNRTAIGEAPTPETVFVSMKVPHDERFASRSVAEHLSQRDAPAGGVDYALKEAEHGIWNETGLIEFEFVNPFMVNNYNSLTKALEAFKKS